MSYIYSKSLEKVENATDILKKKLIFLSNDSELTTTVILHDDEIELYTEDNNKEDNIIYNKQLYNVGDYIFYSDDETNSIIQIEYKNSYFKQDSDNFVFKKKPVNILNVMGSVEHKLSNIHIFLIIYST